MDPAALIWLAIGMGVLVLTLLITMWTRLAQNAFRGPGDVMFKRSPVGFVIFGVITAIICFVPAIVPAENLNDATGFAGLGLIFGGLIWLVFLLRMVLFWAADNQGLTRQALMFKKTLPWQSIDWIYPTRKTTTYRTYGIKTGTSVEEGLMIEAGPKLRTKIVLRNSRGRAKGNKPTGGEALLSVIQQRATNAIVGFDQYPAVRERRAQMGLPQR